MRVLNLHYRDPHNCGDMASTPCSYLHPAAEFQDLHDAFTPADFDLIIIGGGGLLNDGHIPRIREICAAHPRVVLWGVGTNYFVPPHKPYPDVPRGVLCGVRDELPTPQPGVRWIPGASCLNPAFDETYTVERGVGYYGHPRFAQATGGVPNNVRAWEAIRYIGGCERLVTDSYHGAYWGVLLNKPVAICRPWGSKFFHMPWKGVEVVQNPADTPDGFRTHPDALGEARRLNREFAAEAFG